MSWCKQDKEVWKQIIETVASETKRNPYLIEKDTLQSIFLYKLAQSSFPLVFKGGTSLSKAFSIINRFSEDIDLSSSRHLTSNERKAIKNLIVNIAYSLDFVLLNHASIESRHNYNKFVFQYISLFDNQPMEIMIETSFYQEAYPIVLQPIKSYIGEFCSLNGIKLPINFEAMNFNFNVQSLERTFIDKIFAVCDYYIQNMKDRDSRHIYDIAKITPSITFNEDLKQLFISVRQDRLNSKNNPSANYKHNIKEMLSEIIKSNFYEYDYKNITTKLLYEKYDYQTAINCGIEKIINSNLFD